MNFVGLPFNMKIRDKRSMLYLFIRFSNYFWLLRFFHPNPEEFENEAFF